VKKNVLSVGLLLFLVIGLVFQSCQKETADTQTKGISNELAQKNQVASRSYSTTEQLYRQSLQDLLAIYSDANTASNGALDVLLDDLANRTKEDAYEELNKSGLIDVLQLDNTINSVASYEKDMLSMYSEDYVTGVTIDETGGLGERRRKFWGTTTTPTGNIIGGIAGSPCYEEVVKTTWRFWIKTKEERTHSEKRVPCP